VSTTLPSGERIGRRKPELVRAGAGVESLLREGVLPGRVDIAQADRQIPSDSHRPSRPLM
jgi:hypothetical protein